MYVSSPISLLDICKYAVRSGADVDAVDYSGTSVSVMAYNCIDRQYGNSRVGDMWDRILAGAGFDVAAFRKRNGIPRKARYDWGYTRSDFEAMWVGMTELCPYYHEIEAPFDKVYLSNKSLFGFRSLWHQWGEDVVVGGFTENRRGRFRFRYDEFDTEEEWSLDEEESSDDTSNAESNGDSDGDKDIDQDGDGESIIYEVSDEASNQDSGWENDGDSDDDSEDGDNDEGGCRLE
jgi:hypothetical protein